MEFKLKSDFKPTGDQPQAIRDLTEGVETEAPHQTLLGVTGSGKTFTLANVIDKVNRPTLVISHNKTLAAQLYQEFRDFFPKNAVSFFVSYYDYYQPESYLPATDTYIEKETDINDEIDKLRISTTSNLLSRPDTIVVASVSCIYNLGSPLEYAKNFLRITPGQVIDRKTISRRLIDIQYARSDFELKRGTFQIKGDTITIWPANLDSAMRLELLESTIQNIQFIDPVSGEIRPQREDVEPREYTIYPAKHYQSVTQETDDIFKQIKKDLAERLQYFKDKGQVVEAYRLAQKVKYDLEMIQELGYVNGIENYSRYFDGREPGDPPYTLLDYFKYNSREVAKKPFMTIIDESHITIPQLRGMYAGDRSRKQTLIDYGFRLPSALDNRPLKFEEIMERLPQRIYASATPEEWELKQSGNRVTEQIIRPTGLVDPEIDIRPIKTQIPDLAKEVIIRKEKGQRALVTTLTKKTAEALSEYLNNKAKIDKLAQKYSGTPRDIYPNVHYLHADIDTLDRADILDNLREGEYDVVVGINLLREGLDLPEVTLVAILDADKEGFLRSRTSLIQTMGRAARHEEGRVILYADRVTNSMRQAIDEVKRRREIQLEFNHKHNITPKTIAKPIREKLLIRQKKGTPKFIPQEIESFGWRSVDDINPDALTPKDKIELIKKLTRQMNAAAKEWEFEKAATLRDTVQKLK